MSAKLPPEFYKRKDPVLIAKELIGKQLVTCFNGERSAGLIIETEAYSWREKGCHAFGNKLTKRNAPMFEEGGCSYIYLCYGVNPLFNVVTNVKGTAEAVLIRAIEPTEGIKLMSERRKQRPITQLASGPGKLAKALGITTLHSGVSLQDQHIWIENGIAIQESQLCCVKRIGIDYAGKDADLLWRFYLRDSIWISKK